MTVIFTVGVTAGFVATGVSVDAAVAVALDVAAAVAVDVASAVPVATEGVEGVDGIGLVGNVHAAKGLAAADDPEPRAQLVRQRLRRGGADRGELGEDAHDLARCSHEAMPTVRNR